MEKDQIGQNEKVGQMKKRNKIVFENWKNEKKLTIFMYELKKKERSK